MKPVTDSYAERLAFMIELAGHLHAYGTTAQRLEGALVKVAQRLSLACEPWSNPTGLILSFSDRAPGASGNETTRVLRLPPGDTNLYRLAEADRIAEDVMAGRLGVQAGREALRALAAPPRRGEMLRLLLAFALASAALAGILRLPWLDIATAGSIGLLVGLLEMLARKRPQMAEASEALAGLLAASAAILVASLVGPLNLNTVVIASLVALLPGLTLTNAMNELTSRHLVSGTARFAGALTTVLKLVIGTAIAMFLAKWIGLQPQVQASRPQPEWVGWLALLAACYAFAVLFQARRSDYPLVMGAAACGFLVSRHAGEAFGMEAGIFLAALVVTAAGNAYARWLDRPGALLRVPGIIMLVPGSLALRGFMSLVQQQDLAAGQSPALAAINALMAILAGLLFGNLLLPARRIL